MTWRESLTYFMIAELFCGYYLAFNFQVSHISTEAFFPASDNVEINLKQEWAVIQVISSVDYGHDVPLAALLSGALNYQSVHHLFPGVSQYHYPAIAPIVKEVCAKWKVPFNHIPTFSEAVEMHVKYMFQKGQECRKLE